MEQTQQVKPVPNETVKRMRMRPENMEQTQQVKPVPNETVERMRMRPMS
jgi:hypothetical protein